MGRGNTLLKDITPQQIKEAQNIIKKEIDEWLSTNCTSEKSVTRIVAAKYNCYWETIYKIYNNQKCSIATLKKLTFKILEANKEQL